MHSVAASRCTAWTKVILPSQVWKLKAVLYVCFMWIHVLQFFGSIHFQLSRTRLEVCSLWLHPQAREICGREKGTDKGRSYRNRNSSRSLQWPIKVKIFSASMHQPFSFEHIEHLPILIRVCWILCPFPFVLPVLPVPESLWRRRRWHPPLCTPIWYHLLPVPATPCQKSLETFRRNLAPLANQSGNWEYAWINGTISPNMYTSM